MIQRIQSIYLLLAAILMAVTAFSPLLELQGGLTLFSYGVKQTEEIIKPTWGIVFMAGLSAILALVSIFFFKKRKCQANLVLLTAFIVILYYVTALIYLVSYLDNFDFTNSFTAVAYGVVFPVVSLILLIFANKAIKKDDKLVRSLDRIR